ncbi:MAG TPA: RagB/SusD family nutrient uptake outer membrane protein, partial [Candidatus Babeliaceae bacterium]|nr:RagB/SusD family nutrient uptake outer membrane protein [Candidatus Babeliaceae bacterium]
MGNNNIKILMYGWLIAAFLGIPSCKKFLLEKPKSFLSPENFYKSQSDALAALTGAYDGLGDNSSTFLARPLQYLTWYCSDEAYTPSTTSEKQLNNYSFTADQNYILDTWKQMYDAINRDNIVIGRIPGIPMDDSIKQEYIAEGKFLRGLEYFYGVRLWGALPLMTKEVSSVDEAYVARSPVSDVYQLIISDLEFASEHLPAENQNGRATRGAALGILAKVYLTRASSEAADPGDYQKCADLCEEVISMPEHHLMSDYQKVFGPPNEFNAESLFEWQGDRILSPLGEHSILGSFTMPRGIKLFPNQSASDGGIVSTVAFFDLYNEDDYRRE